jgi:hypothetical protein
MGAHFIVGVNQTGNPSLFEWLKGVKLETKTIKTKKEIMELKFYNKIPLNDANHDLELNFTDCLVKDLKRKIIGHFSWITDILVTEENVYQLSRGGRARWKVENETFNTLKNQEYNFEHNYGHGNQHLSHVFSFFLVSSTAALLRTFSSSCKKGKIKGAILASPTIDIYGTLHCFLGRFISLDGR